MAMLAYNEIKPKTIIVLDGEPHLVLSSDIAKRTKQKPVNQTKLKNLISGATTAVSFRQSDKVEEADIEKRPVRFLYQKRAEFWFANPENPSQRMMLEEELVGDLLNFVRPNDVVESLVFNDEIIAVTAPIKVQLKVKQAPPNIKGNTSQGGVKPVTLETDFVVTTPLFIEEGDIVEINTESGEYVTRVKS